MFYFIDFPFTFNNLAFIVHLDSKVKNEDELFKNLSDKLFFPDYFGYNWDAVYDLLRDFDWIKQEEIVLIYDAIPQLEEKTLRIFFQVLATAISDWETGPRDNFHKLRVIFPTDSENSIKNLLKNEKTNINPSLP